MKYQAEEPLHESQRCLSAVLNNTTMAIFLMDEHQRCIYMNPAAEKLTGYTLDEVRGRVLHDVVHHTHPDGSHYPLEECPIDRAFPDSNQMQGEEIFVHKDGSFYPVAFTASPIRDEQALTIGTIIEVRDIRQEKEAQRLQQLLMNELNHRVKNTLATVLSISGQTLRNASSPEQARSDLEGRLLALSRAHDVLTRENWEGAVLSEIVAQAVKPYSSWREDCLDIMGPEVRLAPRIALALAMALQELATNALKYGSLSNDTGQLRIAWSLNAVLDTPELHLRWEETGGPPVPPPARRGFGTRLIERSLARELEGELKFDFAPTGLVCTVNIPLPPMRKNLDWNSPADLLTSVALSHGSMPNDIGWILRAARSHLGMDVAFVSEFTADRRIFRYVDGSEEELPITVGGSGPLEESYCQRVVDGRLPKLIPDTSKIATAMAMPVTTELPVGAHLSIPIRLKDGRVYGTFCCFSYKPDASLNERDLRTMEAFAEITGHLIDRNLDQEQERESKRTRIKTVIGQDRFSIVYQPIYRLDGSSIAGFECLARFSALPLRPPNEWFSEAAEVGLGIELEMAAIQKGMSALSALPSDVYVAVNVSPEMLLSPQLATVFEGLPLKRIVLELTEHAAISDYAALLRAVEPLRQQGLRLAVDDAGAGYASLQHILRLEPDQIKIDASLTQNIDCDPRRRALASALITFSREIDSRIVAEGVETAEELHVLKDLGVEKAQGYFLGRPMPFTNVVQILE
jgi:PAS domain S-box-containing protein